MIELAQHVRLNRLSQQLRLNSEAQASTSEHDLVHAKLQVRSVFFARCDRWDLQIQMSASLHPHSDKLRKLTQYLLLKQRVLLLSDHAVVLNLRRRDLNDTYCCRLVPFEALNIIVLNLMLFLLFFRMSDTISGCVLSCKVLTCVDTWLRRHSSGASRVYLLYPLVHRALTLVVWRIN